MTEDRREGFDRIMREHGHPERAADAIEHPAGEIERLRKRLMEARGSLGGAIGLARVARGERRGYESDEAFAAARPVAASHLTPPYELLAMLEALRHLLIAQEGERFVELNAALGDFDPGWGVRYDWLRPEIEELREEVAQQTRENLGGAS